MKTILILISLLLIGCDNSGNTRLSMLDKKDIDDRQDQAIVENTEIIALFQKAILNLNQRVKKLEGNV